MLQLLLLLLLPFIYYILKIQKTVIFSLLVDDSHTTLICRAYTLSVCTQSLANHTIALQRLLWTCSEFLIRKLHVDRTARNIDDDDVAILNLTDVTTSSSLRTDMADTQT